MAKNIEVTLTLNSSKFRGQLNKAERSMKGFGGAANVTKGSIIGLAARFAPLAAGLVAVTAAFKGISSAVGAAKKIEDIGVVMNNIVGSAEGGAIALQKIRDVAQELPFDFEQIAGAAPALATVSKTINELEENTRLAADIAAVTGLSFEDSASQIQRAFSGGAGAADMFREKGVLAMAGFQAGATYSIDETKKKLKEFGESVDGAANDLNKTLSGAISQTGDRMFNFRASMGGAITPELTAFLTNLVSVFDNNKEKIDAFAKSMGDGVVNSFYVVMRVGATVIDFLTMLGGMFNSVAKVIQDNFGDVIASVMDFAVKAIGGVVEAIGFLGKQIGKLVEFTTGNDSMKKFFENIENAANKARTGGIERVKEALTDMGSVVPETGAQDYVAKLIADMQAAGASAEEQAEVLKKAVLEGSEAGEMVIKQGAKGTTGVLSDFASAAENIQETFFSATSALSDGLAQSLMDGTSVLDNFKDFFRKIVKEMIAQALKLAVIQPILSSIFGAFGFNIDFSSNAITKRAVGGPIMKNKPYLVGEAGPEVINPSGSGVVIPNNALGGGGKTTVTYNIQAVDARSFKQLVASDPEFIYSVTQAGARRIPR
tara:strand:+ start:4133 stop:5935 length:1803 start_codon:yes stop_codon:yes gene_type:complete